VVFVFQQSVDYRDVLGHVIYDQDGLSRALIQMIAPPLLG
jgi:hypothetical protein